MILMTRGKIIFIDEAGRHYQTQEFNGDMYPTGHGETIIEKYEDGGIRSYNDYEKFSISFDRRYFGYADSADELISSFMLEEDCADYTKNWTDYLYVINGSGRIIRALTEDGIIEIPIAEMAVFCFQKFDRMVQIKRGNGIVFPKKKFVEMIDRLREIHDLRDDIAKLIQAKSDMMGHGLPNGSGMLIYHEDSVIELLTYIMDDQEKSIEHFIHGLDYGRACNEGKATDIYGDAIEYKSAEALYDYLRKEMEKKRSNGEASRKIECQEVL